MWNCSPVFERHATSPQVDKRMLDGVADGNSLGQRGLSNQPNRLGELSFTAISPNRSFYHTEEEEREKSDEEHRRA